MKMNMPLTVKFLVATIAVDTPRKALSKALGESPGSISGGKSYDTGVPGALLVVVGPKYDLN